MGQRLFFVLLAGLARGAEQALYRREPVTQLQTIRLPVSAKQLIYKDVLHLRPQRSETQQADWLTETYSIRDRPDGLSDVAAIPLDTVSTTIMFGPRKKQDHPLSWEDGRLNWDTFVNGWIWKAEKLPELVEDPGAKEEMMDELFRAAANAYAAEKFRDIVPQAPHLRQLSQRMMNGLEGLVDVKRLLICTMLPVKWKAQVPHKVSTMEYHTLMQAASIGSIRMLNPSAELGPVDLRELGSAQKVFLQPTEYHYLGLQRQYLVEPRRSMLSELAGEEESREKLRQAAEETPRFVCRQEEVLLVAGLSHHCVYMGSTLATPAEQVATQCLGLYPRGTIVIAQKHSNVLVGGKNVQGRSRWMLRECGKKGWRPWIPLSPGAIEAYKACLGHLGGKYLPKEKFVNMLNLVGSNRSA